MENLRSEISQLRRLFKVKLTDRSGMVYHARVVIMHTVDIRPYLYFTGMDGRSDQGGTVIASPALQVIRLAICVPADETLSNKDIRVREAGQQCSEMLFDVGHIRLTVGIYPHKIEGRKQCRLHSLLLQVKMHHAGGNQFTLRQHHLFIEDGKRSTGKRPYFIETFRYQFQCLFLIGDRGI